MSLYYMERETKPESLWREEMITNNPQLQPELGRNSTSASLKCLTSPISRLGSISYKAHTAELQCSLKNHYLMSKDPTLMHLWVKGGNLGSSQDVTVYAQHSIYLA